MSEVPKNPEMQQVLPEAVEKLVMLYAGDRMATLVNQSPEERDQFWRETAQEFSAFYEIITGLRQSLKKADVTKQAYPPTLEVLISFFFDDVKDDFAKGLLVDLFFARISVAPGYIDYSRVERIEEEVKAMLSELIGSHDSEELQKQALGSVDIHEIVRAVLSGKLKLT